MHPSLERILTRCYERYLDTFSTQISCCNRLSLPGMASFPLLLFCYNLLAAQYLAQHQSCAERSMCRSPASPFSFSHLGEVQVAASQLLVNTQKDTVKGENQRWENIMSVEKGGLKTNAVNVAVVLPHHSAGIST